MKKGFVYTFTRFLSMLNVKVTKTSAEQFLNNHPGEGSMLAYTDALNHFNIENAAAQITVQDLNDLPTPLLTYLKTDGGTFTIIKSIKNGVLTWLHNEKGWIRTKLDEFTEDWSGIVLFAEPDKTSGEPNFKIERQKEILKNSRVPLSIGLLGVMLGIFLITTEIISVSAQLLLFLKFLGMLLTGILLVKSIDSTNTLINKLCNSGTKINCQSILESPAAQITSWLSWSDMGFIYFYGSFFSLLIAVNTSDSLHSFLNLQFLFSVMAVLFSIYSIYYQGAKAKTWCTLCLVTVSLFLLETIVLSSYFLNNEFFFELESVIKPLSGFLIPIIFLLISKNTMIKAHKSDLLQKELVRFKSNPHIFETLMAGQRQMPKIPNELPRVVLGNEGAQHTLTLVSNPLCTPCSKMHRRIEQLLQQNENIKCEMIFISSTDSNNAGGQFVRKVFSLPKELQGEAVHQWYERNDKNFEAWDTKYRYYSEKSGSSNVQAGHNYWSNEAEANGVPTLFLNGKLLPDVIEVEDLAFLLRYATTIANTNGFADQFI